MKILITGGSTEVRIDKVRTISNIFRGRTAMELSSEARRRAHDVTLIGNPHMRSMHDLLEAKLGLGSDSDRMKFVPYRTFDDLMDAMEREVYGERYDCVIHSAAVSDYSVSRVLGPDMSPIDSSGKVGSGHERLYLEMVRTPKIVDRIREPWGFRGVLVKFKLQVDMPDDELLAVAEARMVHSRANLIVANCLEWAAERAYVLGRRDSLGEGLRLNVPRSKLPSALLDAVEG
jgi:phosphopantothenoylcysteine synthetase/decarboxylase